MKWRTLLRCVAVVAVLPVVAMLLTVAAIQATAITPESGTRLSLVIGDKISPYNELKVDNTTFVKATGPGRLDILVRFSFPAGAKDQASWKLKVSEGQKELLVLDTTSKASVATWQESPARPGEGIKKSLEVPAGEHRYSVSLTSPVKSFAGIRYLMSAALVHQEKSAVYPTDMLGTTSVAFKEKEIDFFLADSVKPVKVRIIGPARLRIVTRLAYSGVMKGSQLYSAVITTDYKSAERLPLQTFKALNTYFTNHKEWSVGESKTVFVDVPGGTHEVSVRLGSSSAPALAMRFTIPKEDIGK